MSAGLWRVALDRKYIEKEIFVAVRIRMKKMGRNHRPFFRVCVMDSRTPRDGRVIEEVGFYDPMVRDTDARAILNGERISYWIGVGAQPSDKVKVLIKKYGQDGTHLEQQKAALEKLKVKKMAPAPVVFTPKPKQVPAEEAAAEETATAETVSEEQAVDASATAEETADDQAASTDAPAEEAAS